MPRGSTSSELVKRCPAWAEACAPTIDRPFWHAHLAAPGQSLNEVGHEAAKITSRPMAQTCCGVAGRGRERSQPRICRRCGGFDPGTTTPPRRKGHKRWHQLARSGSLLLQTPCPSIFCTAAGASKGPHRTAPHRTAPNPTPSSLDVARPSPCRPTPPPPRLPPRPKPRACPRAPPSSPRTRPPRTRPPRAARTRGSRSVHAGRGEYGQRGACCRCCRPERAPPPAPFIPVLTRPPVTAALAARLHPAPARPL